MNKKLTGIFAMCALLLTGCQGAKESSKEITPPDTGWGKTVDEVLADWNLDRDQVEIFSETESAAAIAVDTEATVFGEQTSRVMFQFINLDQTFMPKNRLIFFQRYAFFSFVCISTRVPYKSKI